MRLVSWNVNGIRAAWNHGLSAFLSNCVAEVYCFQETKIDEPFRPVEIEGYHAYWSFCKRKKGYAGTLCLTRCKPLQVSYGMGDPDFEDEGRIITLEFADFFLINVYVPNSRRSEMRGDYRQSWDLRFVQYAHQLRYRKPVILCGDLNVADPAEVARLQVEGFISTEREYLEDLIKNGFIDTYRLLHPDEQNKFSWWSNRRFKRKSNQGLRLDYFLVSNALRTKVKESTLLTEVLGSDHCPIALDLDMEWSEDDRLDAVAPSTPCCTYQELLEHQEDEYFINRIKRTDLSPLWKQVDWVEAQNHLQRMQMALAKSSYMGDRTLMQKWQTRIVSALDVKLLAVRHTCETAGGIGVDCIRWDTPHEKVQAALSLSSRGYRAMPSRLKVITTKNGKQRRVHIETYYDRAMQCLYAYALDPIAEAWGDPKSFSYRKGRSAYDLNECIKQRLSGPDAPQWVFMGDVRRCYENISHEWVMEHIPMSRFMLRQFLNSGYVYQGELFPTDVGVGIGCTLSPIIANMALDGLQRYIYKQMYADEEDIDYANGDLMRYADDILILARTEEDARKFQQYTSDFLEERGLELAPEKCRIVHISEGITFMSRTYYKKGEQVYVRPSDAALERFMASLRDTIDHYTGSQRSLIDKLNHQIDGWTSYHRVSEADEAFRRIDIYINALLLQLCESKHPKWKREKIIQRYWYECADGRHCYCLPHKKEIRVKFLEDVLLIDYNPLSLRKNPYIDIDYFEKRTHERAICNTTGVYRTIWNRQRGRCYYCGSKILRDEEKGLVEAFPMKSRFAQRMAYVHRRCMECTVDFIDADTLPASLTDVMELLERLDAKNVTTVHKHFALSEFFRTCTKRGITLTFREIENIMGGELGLSAQHKEYWYRTGFTCISQCWLEHGYHIRSLYLEGRKRVVFALTSKSCRRATVDVPEEILYGQVPAEAKYELENYFQYIIKKYGL